jgi:hypothetical protein
VQSPLASDAEDVENSRTDCFENKSKRKGCLRESPSDFRVFCKCDG